MKKPALRSRMEEYFNASPPLSEAEQKELNKLVLELVIDLSTGFSVVERPSFHRLLDFLRPQSSRALKGRWWLSEKILNDRYNKALENRNKSILEAFMQGHHFGIVVDGWEMINKVHIQGVMVKAGPKSFLLSTYKEGDTHHALAIAKVWEEDILRTDTLRPYAHKVKYFVSDNAGQCARARRILSLRHPYILFHKCWAHQVNLMVGHLVQTPQFKDVANKAITAAAKVSKSLSKWLVRLQQICRRTYGSKVATTIMTVGDTRWNTIQGCFASQLRIRKACILFVAEYGDDDEFPKACKAWETTDFFHSLEEAEYLVRPFCDASFLMQRECNTLADVFLMLLNLYLHVLDFVGSEDQIGHLTLDLGERWAQCEQPLYVLAFALHPAYKEYAVHVIAFNEYSRGSWPANRIAVLSSMRLAWAAGFYWEKHELSAYSGKSDPTSVRKLRIERNNLVVAVHRYLTNHPLRIKFTLPYDPEMFPSIVDWYLENRACGEAFCRFAAWILGAPVQSASCERLFKDFALFNTKSRNRLSQAKMEKSTLIKHDMQVVYGSDDTDTTGHGGGKKKKRFKTTNQHRNRIVSTTEYPKTTEESTGEAAGNRDKTAGAANNNEEEDVQEIPNEQLRSEQRVERSTGGQHNDEEEYDSNDEFLPINMARTSQQQDTRTGTGTTTETTETVTDMDDNNNASGNANTSDTQLGPEMQQLLDAIQSSFPDDESLYDEDPNDGTGYENEMHDPIDIEELDGDSDAGSVVDFAAMARENAARLRTEHSPTRAGRAAQRAAAAATEQLQPGYDEDPPETRSDTLEPLPSENLKNFAQEDKRYFSRKDYVRRDKYLLAEFILGRDGMKLPSIMGAFKHH